MEIKKVVKEAISNLESKDQYKQKNNDLASMKPKVSEEIRVNPITPNEAFKIELTFGQKAVGLNFNPSGDDKVGVAKQLMADAIDLLEKDHLEKEEAYKNTPGNERKTTWIRNVFRTAAFNAIITAQMAVVKYLTWKD